MSTASLVCPEVENVDPWPGMLSEDPYPGAFVGETMRAVMIEQFTANRDGDRFFYKVHTRGGGF